MLRLLNIEWLKFKSNGFMIVLSFVFVVLFVWLIPLMKDQINNLMRLLPSSSDFVQFPTVWEYQGYLGNWLVSLCLGFMVIYSITSEVANKTMRQNIITGLTRREYFTAKFGVVMVLSIVATLIYYISSLGFGVWYTDGYDAELMFDNNWAGVRFWLMSVGYLSFALFCGLLIRKGFLSLLTYFVYMMMIEPIIRAIHLARFDGGKLASLYPLNLVEDNFPIPILRMGASALKMNTDVIVLDQSEAMMGTAVYIIIFLGVSYWLFQRNDV